MDEGTWGSGGRLLKVQPPECRSRRGEQQQEKEKQINDRSVGGGGELSANHKLPNVVGLLDDYGIKHMVTGVPFQGEVWHREAAWAGGRWTDVRPHTCTTFAHILTHIHIHTCTRAHKCTRKHAYTQINKHARRHTCTHK